MSIDEPDGGWFRVYLRGCQIRDTPTGDFVRDSRAIQDFPRVETLDDLLSFMQRRGACLPALKAAKASWRNYVRWLRGKDFYAYLKIKDRKAWEEVPEEIRNERF